MGSFYALTASFLHLIFYQYLSHFKPKIPWFSSSENLTDNFFTIFSYKKWSVFSTRVRFRCGFWEQKKINGMTTKHIALFPPNPIQRPQVMIPWFTGYRTSLDVRVNCTPYQIHTTPHDETDSISYTSINDMQLRAHKHSPET